VNWCTPGWNAILKRTPTFSSSANLVRWFSLYIPVVAVFAGLALDRLSGNAAARMAIAVAVTVATIAINAFTDKEYYRNQKHNGSVIVASWNLVRTKEDVPFVAENAMGDVNRLAFGYSRLRCYQPMFGYFGQFFIVGAIGSGPILWQAAPERINFKNPACYLFPEENQCVPGDEFTTSQMDEAATLASYRTFDFNRPLIQKIAGWVNLATLAAALLVLVGVPVLWLFGRRTKGASPPAV
jgi:hypothetical protein